MAVVSEMMKESIEQGSLIRQMFDLGIKTETAVRRRECIGFQSWKSRFASSSRCSGSNGGFGKKP